MASSQYNSVYDMYKGNANKNTNAPQANTPEPNEPDPNAPIYSMYGNNQFGSPMLPDQKPNFTSVYDIYGQGKMNDFSAGAGKTPASPLDKPNQNPTIGNVPKPFVPSNPYVPGGPSAPEDSGIEDSPYTPGSAPGGGASAGFKPTPPKEPPPKDKEPDTPPPPAPPPVPGASGGGGGGGGPKGGGGGGPKGGGPNGGGGGGGSPMDNPSSPSGPFGAVGGGSGGGGGGGGAPLNGFGGEGPAGGIGSEIPGPGPETPPGDGGPMPIDPTKPYHPFDNPYSEGKPDQDPDAPMTKEEALQNGYLDPVDGVSPEVQYTDWDAQAQNWATHWSDGYITYTGGPGRQWKEKGKKSSESYVGGAGSSDSSGSGSGSGSGDALV